MSLNNLFTILKVGKGSGEEKKWWEEDAERLNKMAEIARNKGKIIKTGKTKPPELNKDGSEKG